MISGIGIDTVTVSRIERLIARYGDRFLMKIFTGEEISEGSVRFGRGQFFAARFAAREAFFKALGTGMGRGISMKEVRVAKDGSGKPYIVLSGPARKAIEEKNVSAVHLSITHEGDLAQAIVILEGG